MDQISNVADKTLLEYHYPKEFYDINGPVVTRFPPENNGFLHLGHVKAMEIDFSFAKENNGVCILRFDDTNPNAECAEFYDAIREDVNWMGYEYIMETNTSDYFDVLYEYAKTLIKQGDAFICELSSEELRRYRHEKIPSPFRDRPIEESLRLFEEMKSGVHHENAMTLRMKGDLDSNNTTLWDIVMYRTIKKPHSKTDDKWVIYPSYDYSHGIIDSIENISHSFCTKEYEIRRDQYYWFIEKLGMRKPYVYEFGRMEVENGTLSKRNIKAMIENKTVTGWDDPRLLTIRGLRRRGYTQEALKDFCRNAGVTKNEVTLTRILLENIIRDKLNQTTPRKLAVFNPLKLIITNHLSNIECDCMDFPFDKNSTTRKVTLTKEFYIDSSSFKEVDEKNFYGLAPGKTIRIKYGPFVEFESFDKENNIVYVKFVEPLNPKKIKGILNWVGSDYNEVTVRSFDLMNMTELICYVEPGINKSTTNVEDKFQFEKYGFYCVDKDSLTENKLIFNETVKLKSSY